jgi:hypothetical protein
MPTTITSVKAVERSTFVVTVSFLDEDDSPVIPNSATWSLVDIRGDIINGREDVVISPLDSTVDILLSGNDLVVTGGHDEDKRYLVVEAVYDSDLGSGLPLKDHLVFYVQNLKKVQGGA